MSQCVSWFDLTTETRRRRIREGQEKLVLSFETASSFCVCQDHNSRVNASAAGAKRGDPNQCTETETSTLAKEEMACHHSEENVSTEQLHVFAGNVWGFLRLS